MSALEQVQRLHGVVIVTGHYGVGKTNLVLNMAKDALAAGQQVTVADMDVVNPYFRSSEYNGFIEGLGGTMVCPVLAHTSVDVPSLSSAILGAIEWARSDAGNLLIIDAGGDDVGATALGRFTRSLSLGPYELIYVVNSRRNLTQEVDEAAGIMQEIIEACHLQPTMIAGNDHLKQETTPEMVRAGYEFAQALSQRANVPFAFQTTPKWLIKPNVCDVWLTEHSQNIYPVEIIVRTPWE